MSAYFLELERLLDRVERSSTFFQVLGVERTASRDDVLSAYQAALEILFPPYKVGSTLPADLLGRMKRAFDKSTEAFSVLASYAIRKEYESAPGQKAGKPAPAQSPPVQAARLSAPAPLTAQGAGPLDHPVPPLTDESFVIKRMPRQKEVRAEFANKPGDSNRRRCERLKLSLPARVTGYDRLKGKWNEMVQTTDVSRTGTNVMMRRHVRHGTVVYLTLPLPAKLRSHGYADSSYNVYALVRRVEPAKNGMRLVGFEFLGEHPPAGFLENPWMTFRTREWSGIERRRPPRHARAEMVSVEYLTESMYSLGKDLGRTENVSSTGARICVRTAPPPEYDIIRFSCSELDFECFARVCNRYLGKDGKERLCLQFIEKQLDI
jgi:hypothetical protein